MKDKVLEWLQKRIFLLVSISFLFIAILWGGRYDYLPEGFYQILRFLLCGTCAYFSYICVGQSRKNWAWTLGIIAFLFNPFIPIHFDKEEWRVIDFIVAIVLITFLIRFRKSGSST